MERILTTEERIKRAEEIYQRRRNINNIRTIVNKNESVEKHKIGLFKKMIIQIIVCFAIYLVFYTVQNSEYIFSEELINQTHRILEKDIDFEQIYNKSIDYIKKIDFINFFKTEEDMNNQEDASSTMLKEDATLSVSEEESNEKVVEKAENKSISQMELDAKDINKKFKFIKPIEGIVTSRFGYRNPTTTTVPTYHTGIDLAASRGTVIKAAIDGTVEICSSQGDYGKHLKIVNGDIATIYAHCNKLYVKRGDQIKQGDMIAEVGNTGNATGPHLHFEIRKSERYVDPDYILKF